MRVRLDSSSLERTSSEMRDFAQYLESLERELAGVMGGLTLESRRRSDVDSSARSVGRGAGGLSESYQELASYSKSKAENFTYADDLGKPIEKRNWLKFAGVVVSLGLDFIPIVGNAKGVIEALIGRDLFTGDKLSVMDRSLGVLGPFGKAVSKGSKVINLLDDAVGMAVVTERAIDGARSAERAVDSVTDVVRGAERAADGAADVAKAADHVPPPGVAMAGSMQMPGGMELRRQMELVLLRLFLQRM